MYDVCTLQDLFSVDDQGWRQPDDVSLGQCRLGLKKEKKCSCFSAIITGAY